MLDAAVGVLRDQVHGGAHDLRVDVRIIGECRGHVWHGTRAHVIGGGGEATRECNVVHGMLDGILGLCDG
jgi:hypothetical protein